MAVPVPPQIAKAIQGDVAPILESYGLPSPLAKALGLITPNPTIPYALGSIKGPTSRAIKTLQNYDFGDPFHRAKVNAIKQTIGAGTKPFVELRKGDLGEWLVTNGTHTLQAYKELGVEPVFKVIRTVD